MSEIVKKKSFEKDETAKQLVQLMTQENFSELPDTIKANQLDISVADYNKYMNDPHFLRWAVKNMQDLYVQKLPEVMNTIYNQALQGHGRQQKMLLDFMKITNENQETKSPNIVIVNNIPNPDRINPEDVVTIDEAH